MGIVTAISIPGREFELGRPLQNVPNATVTFEQLVPTTDAVFPYVWVYTDEAEAFERHLLEDPAVDTATVVYQDGEKVLYNIEWYSNTDGFLACLSESEATVLEAHGSATSWEFEHRFGSHETLSAFQQTCLEQDVSLSVERLLTKSVVDSPAQKLSQCQYETIELALERGYFDVPRRCTMVELSEELGISDQAVSARLRRAMKALSEQFISREQRLPGHSG